MIRIVTDSVASIPADIAEKGKIDVVTLYVNYKGQEYVDATMDVDDFYRDIYNMADDLPTSSQPSALEFESLFESIAESGDEMLGIFMSSQMSGTFDMALRAARSVEARHAGFKFALIDSTSNCFEEGFPVLSAVAARDSGATLEQCVDAAVESVRNTRWLFSPETLRFLKKGGRIGGAAALLGSVVKICPVLSVSDGETSPVAKVRTHAKALAKMVEIMDADIKKYGFRNAVVHYIGDSKPAFEWARKTIEPLLKTKVLVLPVSPVIGTHVGPALGVIYECLNPLPGKLSLPTSSIVHYS